MNDYVYQIFEAVFECTLTMISRNFEDYPEHRVGFYKLLQAINMYCFSGKQLFIILARHLIFLQL